MYRRYIKRFMDIFISFIALPFVILVSIPIAILIKLEDGGSVFYYGNRFGYRMKPFKIFKFRSMHVYAPDIRNLDGSTYNSSNDPRMTRVGRILRKTSIDELPQVVNILLGQMSFVGPRPSPLGNTEMYSEEYKHKFEVRPGITGYNQAYFRNSLSVAEKQRNDLYYVYNFSFLLDMKIICKTVATVFSCKSTYTNNAKKPSPVEITEEVHNDFVTSSIKTVKRLK